MNGMPLLSFPPPDPPNIEEPNCRKCSKEFNFLFTRPKRCQHCGYAYCSSCADYQALLPRSSDNRGYDPQTVCAFCIEMLNITASSKNRLRTFPISKLRAYMKAYNISASQTAVEKDDLVSAILEAKNSDGGCLMRHHEEYYRMNSVPQGGAQPRGLFSRSNRSQQPSTPPQPDQRQYAPPPGPPPQQRTRVPPRPSPQESNASPVTSNQVPPQQRARMPPRPSPQESNPPPASSQVPPQQRTRVPPGSPPPQRTNPAPSSTPNQAPPRTHTPSRGVPPRPTTTQQPHFHQQQPHFHQQQSHFHQHPHQQQFHFQYSPPSSYQSYYSENQHTPNNRRPTASQTDFHAQTPPPPHPHQQQQQSVPTPPPRPNSASPTVPPQSSSASAPRRPSAPTPDLDELLNMSSEEISRLAISTLKSILFDNRVRTSGALEKSDLVKKVLSLVADERFDRAVKEREEREEAERMECARQERLREEEKRQEEERARREEHHTNGNGNNTTATPKSSPASPAGPPSDASPPPVTFDHSHDGLCVICQDEHANMAIIDCGHLALCKACSETVMKTSRECPLCRTRIVTEQRLLRIFKT